MSARGIAARRYRIVKFARKLPFIIDFLPAERIDMSVREGIVGVTFYEINLKIECHEAKRTV